MNVLVEALITIGLLAAPAATVGTDGGGVPSDRSIVLVLPVRDRVGDRATREAVAAVVREELAARLRPVDSGDLRDALRKIRMRDPGSALPEALDRLAEEFDAEWIVGITVHQADLRTGVPQVTLAGHAHRVGRRTLAWAGFEARSGLDERTILGLGEIEELDRLAERAARELAVRFLRGAGPTPPSGRAPFAYRAPGFAPGEHRRVAVVPFDAVGGPFDSSETGGLVTDAALAALHARGIEVVHPGIVGHVLRERGLLWRGEFDGMVRAALGIRSSPDLVLSGTVEHFEVGRLRAEPNPEVAVGVHAVTCDEGRLVYIGGIDRHGRDRAGAFDTRREHSVAALAFESVSRLLDDLWKPQTRASRATRSNAP